MSHTPTLWAAVCMVSATADTMNTVSLGRTTPDWSMSVSRVKVGIFR